MNPRSQRKDCKTKNNNKGKHTNVYLVCDVWSYIARISSTFDDNVFVLVTVQQFKCFPNLKTAHEQHCHFTNVSSCKYLDLVVTHLVHSAGRGLHYNLLQTQTLLPWQFPTMPSLRQPPVSSQTYGRGGYEGVWLVLAHIRLNVRSHASSPQEPPWCCLPVACCLRHRCWYLRVRILTL